MTTTKDILDILREHEILIKEIKLEIKNIKEEIKDIKMDANNIKQTLYDIKKVICDLNDKVDALNHRLDRHIKLYHSSEYLQDDIPDDMFEEPCPYPYSETQISPTSRFIRW